MVHRVCQRTPPLAVRYYELWCSEWLRDIRVDTVSQMQHVLDRVEWSLRSSEDLFRSVEVMECSNGFDL